MKVETEFLICNNLDSLDISLMKRSCAVRDANPGISYTRRGGQGGTHESETGSEGRFLGGAGGRQSEGILFSIFVKKTQTRS